MKSAVAAALLAGYCGILFSCCAHGQVLMGLQIVIAWTNRRYPTSLSIATRQIREAAGHTPYTFPDLAVHIKSSIDAYKQGSLRKPVTSFRSHGGERDFSVAVWSCDQGYTAVFEDQCGWWELADGSLGDQCADTANGVIATSWQLANPAEGFEHYNLAIFWHPTHTYAALQHPTIQAKDEALRVEILTAILRCRYWNSPYSSLPLEERTPQAFLDCLLPQIEDAHPLPRDGPLLLMPAGTSDGSFAAEEGGMTVLYFSKEAAEEVLSPGGHDWRLILSIRTERMPAVPPTRYRLSQAPEAG